MKPFLGLLLGVVCLLPVSTSTSGSVPKGLADCPQKESSWYIQHYGHRAYLYLAVMINSRNPDYVDYNCADEEAAHKFLYYGTFKGSKESVKLDFTGSKTEYRDVYGFLKEAGIELGEKMKNTLSKDLNMMPEHIGCYFDQGKKKATCVLKLKDNRQ